MSHGAGSACSLLSSLSALSRTSKASHSQAMGSEPTTCLSQLSALHCTLPNKDTRNYSCQEVVLLVPSKGMGLLAHSMRCVAWDARSCWESPWLTVTWAFVQLPGLSYISLTEPHALANGWPDAIVVSTGKDGV